MDAARVRPDGAGNEIKQRRLARAVGTDQSQNLAGRYRKRHAIDRDQSAERLG